MQLVGLHFLLALLNFHFVLAIESGMCMKTVMVSKIRYVLNRKNNSLSIQEYKEPEERKECCEGYKPSALKDSRGIPKFCTPVCKPECENAECTAPNVCACYPGHQLINNSTSECYDVCDVCVHGACHGNETECTCDSGYKRDENIKHVCNPICSPSCVNGTCSKPGICECFDGFIKVANQHNVCVPECSQPCVSGTCTDPNICTCHDGYMNDELSSSICLPVCNQTCKNGFCAEPNVCRCNEGFVMNPRNRCIPKALQNSSLNFCEFKMDKAIKYDDEDCFIIKDKVNLIGNSYCHALKFTSDNWCTMTNSCSILDKCITNIQCSTVKLSGVNEIYCNLGTDDFEAVITSRNVTGTEWSDLTFTVNSFQAYNNFSSDIMVKHQTEEWCLHPLSTEPVCGTDKHFGVELCECAPTPLNSTHSLNSSLITSMNVFLIISLLLLVVAGGSGFLWMRHRRLNNPLNYREDMMRGYYTNESYNQSYNHQTGELVSDDESDHDSCHPL